LTLETGLGIFYRIPGVRDPESTQKAQQETQKNQAFDPAAQDQGRLPPERIHM